MFTKSAKMLGISGVRMWCVGRSMDFFAVFFLFCSARYFNFVSYLHRKHAEC